jgi:leucyl-tRNA synthetase
MRDFNCVVMFPYPSGAGLHLGHYYNYAVIDSYCRWLRLRGDAVFQPFGYDAFGLPAENYAKSIGGDPKEVTYANIERFRAQMARMNTQYEERLVTCDPSYVKWTQWLFLRLRDHGLAYKAEGPVNWCPSCETVLANEQVKNGACNRCEATVQTRTMNQWYFRITTYKYRLIENLTKIDYPEGTKKQQERWLEGLRDWCVSRQRKWGAPIPMEGETDTLDTFVDSSFYYLRYLTDSTTEFLPRGCWRPVDLYVGGNEHACMHLIYARFVHMFLYDIGVVPEEEPFRRVIHQGMITRNGAKMGKSKGNAVNPDDYDPDELRTYLMFLGHYFDGGDWDDSKIVGIRRFLGRMRTWLARTDTEPGVLIDLTGLEAGLNRYVEAFKFNKAVSEFMVFYNKRHNQVVLDRPTRGRVVELLRVFAPGFKV